MPAGSNSNTMGQDKIQSFEENVQQYEDWFEKNKFVYFSELKAVEMLLPDMGQGVEVGVGSGRFAEPLGIYWGIDPSEKMMQLAKQRSIKPVKGVAEFLPFKTNAVDFVLMVTTICFVCDAAAATREVFRVLKPGGSILIGFVDKESDLGRQYQKKKNQSVFYQDAKFFSVDEIQNYLKQTGFTRFEFSQTLFKSLDQISEPEPVQSGFGNGAFVVIKGTKP